MTLLTRSHTAEDGTVSHAVYSNCERYRYALTRVWNEDAPRLLFVMLNPSKATELANDPTVERCERRARALNYGAMQVCNIFAWRETDPAQLKKSTNPVGAENDDVLTEAASWSDHVLCAWGVHGEHLDRGLHTATLLEKTGADLFSLGVTKHGHPRHPLYVAYVQKLEPWQPYPLRS